MKVTGKVVAPGTSPTALGANLHFVATSLYGMSQGQGESCTTAAGLSYDAFVSTSGGDAAFSVTLPQGLYSITIDPTGAPSTVAKSIVQAQYPQVGVGTCPATGDIADQVLTPVPVVPATGSVRVADGRPLAGATVSFTAAAFLLTDPTAPSPVDWPRSFQVMTDPQGNFSTQVDAGLYDITVRPVDGSRFPWIVYTAQSFTQSFGALPLRLKVPAPSLLSLTIQDPNSNGLSQAVVRAFAFAPCTPIGTGQCNDVAVQIGEALTDATGSFEMFLAPSPFPADGLGSEVAP